MPVLPWHSMSMAGVGASLVSSELRQESPPKLKTLVVAWSVLVLIGMVWGLSFSLARLAATQGAHPLGIAAWESWIAGLLLLCLSMVRRVSLPITSGLLLLHFVTSLVGMVVPGAAIFYAASHTPAGV